MPTKKHWIVGACIGVPILVFAGCIQDLPLAGIATFLFLCAAFTMKKYDPTNKSKYAERHRKE
jgi:membrane-bound metal-dependent hydrolase YbcI (DUF457 family)